MSIFKTFEAKLHGIAILSNPGDPTFADGTITFTRSRIKLKDFQKGRLLNNIMAQQTISDDTKYTFSKGYNRSDNKVFFVEIDSVKFVLGISKWNKIKANVIHNQYWIDREKDWFIKTLIAAAIGFIFGIIGSIAGYQKGHQDGIKEGKAQIQDTTLKR